MKFKHLLLTASVMALFSSCSNDELVSESTSHGDAIAFSVTTTNATRAADYWCNNQLPKYFEVSAMYNKASYFNGDVYTAESNKYINADGIDRYWPAVSESLPLNVYAYKVKADGTDAIGSEFATFSWPDNWTVANAAPTITYDMSEKKAAADQHDLLYAYTQVKEKPGFGKTAPINFRHALSQIVFYAKCENTKVYVEIEEIALVNAAKKGVFTLPTGTNVTDDYLIDHTQAGTAKSDGLGTWALEYDNSNEYYGYVASCKDGNNLKIIGSTLTNLTDNTNANDKHTEITQSLLVLPQTKYSDTNNNNVAKYVPYTDEGGTKTYKKLSEVGGACIAIKCRIRNIAGSTVADNDVYLWGSAPTESSTGAEYLVVPVDFTWEQGKKYIYNINFSKTGHGGYDPDNGKEVLVPIQLDVKVDDFAKVTEITPNF